MIRLPRAWRQTSASWLYDVGQELLGFRATASMVAPYLLPTKHQLVLDVGGGTGMWGRELPASARYICLDSDRDKLYGVARRRCGPAVQADATALPLRDRSVDYALSHHLNDEALARLLSELARVIRHGLIFLDAVRVDRVVPRVLWRLDRGSYPRDEAALLAAIAAQFSIREIRRFAVYHSLVLCTAQPPSP